jgi:hypothetical protein
MTSTPDVEWEQFNTALRADKSASSSYQNACHRFFGYWKIKKFELDESVTDELFSQVILTRAELVCHDD